MDKTKNRRNRESEIEVMKIIPVDLLHLPVHHLDKQTSVEEHEGLKSSKPGGNHWLDNVCFCMSRRMLQQDINKQLDNIYLD